LYRSNYKTHLKGRIIGLSETSWLDGLTGMTCQVLSIIVLWDARLCAGNKVHVMIKIGHLYSKHRFVDFSLRSSVQRRPATNFSQLTWGMVVKKTVKYNNKCICFQSNTTLFYYCISVNQIQSFRPSSGHHHIKFKRMVLCSVHSFQVIWDPIYTNIKIC
jgi:hypothetical protein